MARGTGDPSRSPRASSTTSDEAASRNRDDLPESRRRDQAGIDDAENEARQRQEAEPSEKAERRAAERAPEEEEVTEGARDSSASGSLDIFESMRLRGAVAAAGSSAELSRSPETGESRDVEAGGVPGISEALNAGGVPGVSEHLNAGGVPGTIRPDEMTRLDAAADRLDQFAAGGVPGVSDIAEPGDDAGADLLDAIGTDPTSPGDPSSPGMGGTSGDPNIPELPGRDAAPSTNPDDLLGNDAQQGGAFDPWAVPEDAGSRPDIPSGPFGTGLEADGPPGTIRPAEFTMAPEGPARDAATGFDDDWPYGPPDDAEPPPPPPDPEPQSAAQQLPVTGVPGLAPDATAASGLSSSVEPGSDVDHPQLAAMYADRLRSPLETVSYPSPEDSGGQGGGDGTGGGLPAGGLVNPPEPDISIPEELQPPEVSPGLVGPGPGPFGSSDVFGPDTGGENTDEGFGELGTFDDAGF
jgi:hypothetical protein